ncbi:SIMPL domain-containing protein [soil metagenome]
MFKYDNSWTPAVIVGGLLAVGLIGGGAFVGNGIVNAQVGNRQVTVRGVAERPVVADLAVLTLSFGASGDDLDALQSKLEGDLGKVRAFLVTQGYPDDVLTNSLVSVTDNKANAYQPAQTDVLHYTVSQSVVIRTHDVARVAQTQKSLDTLIKQDVILSFVDPVYVFTKLNDVRPSMIAEATASARSGAEQFAKDSGAPLGPIRQATQGSFEILAREDIDTESSSVNKRVRVVATVTYQLK